MASWANLYIVKITVVTKTERVKRNLYSVNMS